jgi:hypothetical protein
MTPASLMNLSGTGGINGKKVNGAVGGNGNGNGSLDGDAEFIPPTPKRSSGMVGANSIIGKKSGQVGKNGNAGKRVLAVRPVGASLRNCKQPSHLPLLCSD